MSFWTQIVLTGSGGGSLTVLIPVSGAIDGVNTQYSFTKKPSSIIASGMSYRENNGWTWNSGTLTATLDFAPTSPGDVYGIV